MELKTKITKKEVQEFVKTKLRTDKQWATTALLRIFDFQTKEEQKIGGTLHNNNIGFSGCDAEILTSFAKQYIRRGSLSEKQMVILFKKIHKYHRQIIKISDQKKAYRIFYG